MAKILHNFTTALNNPESKPSRWKPFRKVQLQKCALKLNMLKQKLLKNSYEITDLQGSYIWLYYAFEVKSNICKICKLWFQRLDVIFYLVFKKVIAWSGRGGVSECIRMPNRLFGVHNMKIRDVCHLLCFIRLSNSANIRLCFVRSKVG